MQVNTSIDEADVGKITIGMETSFTVDAYPGETFSGRISQIRLAATTVQNVVTYNAIVNVGNPQLKLKPGMTANVKILIKKVTDTLKVPNAALRFRPSAKDTDIGIDTGGRKTAVWIVSEDTGALRPVYIKLGLTDGISTQVLSGNLKWGDRIVTGTELDPKNTSNALAKTRTAGFGSPMGSPAGPPPP